MIDELRREVNKLANPSRAGTSEWFFKTGKGQYGEGDVFAGLTVPQSRIIAKKFANLDLSDIETLLNSKIHEERLISLIILCDQFSRADNNQRKIIFNFYIKNASRINNWDLVDLSAPKIVGAYISQNPDSVNKERKILFRLAKSDNLWEKRISIISTLYLIVKGGEYEVTFEIAEILLNDKHDLIQKAVGWMLREVGKRVSQKTEEEFLKKHYKQMPRTMLRYSIERFPTELKLKYMKGLI